MVPVAGCKGYGILLVILTTTLRPPKEVVVSISIENAWKRAAIASMIAALLNVVSCALLILTGITYAVQGDMPSAYVRWLGAFVSLVTGVIFLMAMKVSQKNSRIFIHLRDV
jgi:hypothetical protein